MKTDEITPIRLEAPCLPDDIYASFEPFEQDLESVDQDLFQNQSGRNLIKEMVDIYLNEEEFHILTQKNEKPKAFCSKRELSVSFSHTNNGVSGTISFSYNVGCDMEHIDRDVHPRLMERIKNKGESGELYENVDPVRIWTLKESALKMIGTGLRKPMNSVQISQVDKNGFDVSFDNGNRAKICSFQYKYHWISVCYQDGFTKI